MSATLFFIILNSTTCATQLKLKKVSHLPSRATQLNFIFVILYWTTRPTQLKFSFFILNSTQSATQLNFSFILNENANKLIHQLVERHHFNPTDRGHHLHAISREEARPRSVPPTRVLREDRKLWTRATPDTERTLFIHILKVLWNHRNFNTVIFGCLPISLTTASWKCREGVRTHQPNHHHNFYI